MFNFFKSKKNDVLMGSVTANDAVRHKLSEMGDDGSRARHVIHFAYPLGAATVEDVTEIKEYFLKLGFKVRNAIGDGGLSFEHHHAVATEEFDTLTDTIAEFFTQRDWTYDGWECAVKGQ